MLTSATQQSTSSASVEASSGVQPEHPENSGGKSMIKVSMSQSSNVPCRDILDPAPHHTPADIRVLEILKRIRDSGDTEDDSPPVKKKSRTHRNTTAVARDKAALSPKVLSSPKPAPILKHNQPPQSLRSANLPDLRQPLNSQSISPVSLDDYLSTNGTPLLPAPSSHISFPLSTASLLPSSSKNGCVTPFTKTVTLPNPSSLVIPQTAISVAQPALTNWLSTITVPANQVKVEKQSVPPVTAPGNQVSIGIELVLPNGLRIPVSATCAPATTQATETLTQNSDLKPVPFSSLASMQTNPVFTSQSSSSLPQPPAIKAETPADVVLVGGATAAASTLESPSKSRICSCLRSKCLKLYCDCFAAGRACDGCHCRSCQNSDDVPTDNEVDGEEDKRLSRDFAMRSALARNPLAFKSKIETESGSGAKHMLGCRCKRSQCQKNYCECYLAGIRCNQRCQCLSCSNEAVDEGKKLANGSNFALSRSKGNWVNLSMEERARLQRTKSNLIKNDTIFRTGSIATTISPATTNQIVQPAATLPQPNSSNGSGQSAMNSLLLSSPMGDSSDILSCLRNVLPPGSLQPNNSFRVVTAVTRSSQLSTAALNSAGAPNVTVPDILQALPTNLPTLANEIIATVASGGKEPPDAAAAASDLPPGLPAPIDYSDYTEEELEFMQHLLEIRNTTTEEKSSDASPTRQSLQNACRNLNTAGSSNDGNGVGATGSICGMDLSPERPHSLPMLHAFVSAPDSIERDQQNRKFSISAPASVTSSGREDTQSRINEADFQSMVLEGDSANNSVGVPQLLRKIDYLENRVSKLMKLVYAQGSALRKLSARMRNQAACEYCAHSSSSSSTAHPFLPNEKDEPKNSTS